MQECKHCGCEQIVKNGIVQGKQRYLCNGCKRTFREGDQRVKYSGEVRIRTLKWYLDGAGIRAIERNEGVPAPLILQWIRKSGALLKEQISRIQPPDDLKKIQILELDELYTYCKKNSAKPIFGWLSIGSETKWWILK